MTLLASLHSEERDHRAVDMNGDRRIDTVKSGVEAEPTNIQLGEIEIVAEGDVRHEKLQIFQRADQVGAG